MRKVLLAALVLVVGVVVVACGGGEQVARPTAETAAPGEPSMSGLPFSEYSHEDEPFARALFSEQVSIAQEDDDELVFVPGDFDGVYTNVTDYSRHGYRPVEPPVLEVWFFGGSTLFGIGQRDEHTIPSEVAKLAEAEGVPIRVETFGFPSWESWQEVGMFRRVLGQRAAPDLVVFYHGANDYAGVCRRLANGVDPYDERAALFDPLPAVPEVSCQADPDATGELLADLTGRRMADAKEAAGEVPLIEFWQPFAPTRRPTPDEAPLRERLGATEHDFRVHAAPYLRAPDLMEREVVDLTDAMDSADGPVYFDWAHTNELGADLVARAMWDRSLRDWVTALFERRP